MLKDKLNPHVDIGTSRIYLNPGTGPVEGAIERQATQNIAQLVTDVGLEGMTFRRDSPKDYGQGRFAYQLRYDKRDIEVQMPGLPLEQVRFLGRNDQDIFDFPRLYVNGSSWLWEYATSRVRDICLYSDEY